MEPPPSFRPSAWARRKVLLLAGPGASLLSLLVQALARQIAQLLLVCRNPQFRLGLRGCEASA